MDIRFVKRDVLKEKPDQKHLGFGKYMTDYMFVMDWTTISSPPISTSPTFTARTGALTQLNLDTQ